MKVHLYVAIGQYFDVKTRKDEGDVIGVYREIEEAYGRCMKRNRNGGRI